MFFKTALHNCNSITDHLSSKWSSKWGILSDFRGETVDFEVTNESEIDPWQCLFLSNITAA